MSDAFNAPALGATPGAGYDAPVDYRSLDQIQQGAPAGAPTTQAASYGADGMDLRSADEISRSGMPATMQNHDKGPGFVSDVGTGFVRAAKNTFRGVVLLGKGVVGIVAHPSETRAKINQWGTYAAQHPGQTISHTLTLPFRMAGAMVQPYTDSIKSGRPGLAVGQLGFDAALAYATVKAVDVVRNGSGGATPAAGGGDDAGVMSTGGSGGKGVARGGGAGSSVQQTAKVGNVKVGNIVTKGNNNVININIGSNTATSSGGTSAMRHMAEDVTSNGVDDVAGTLSKTSKTQSIFGRLFGEHSSQITDEAATGASQQPGFLQRLFGGGGGGSSWQGTRNMASPKSTFQAISNGIDNGVSSASTVTSSVTTGVGNAFDNGVRWIDRGLVALHPDNLVKTAQTVGNAVVAVPKFILENPGTSLKYAVAGTATAVYTTGKVFVNSARFAIANPGQALVLVAATGRTVGALPVRNEQRSSASYDPDL